MSKRHVPGSPMQLAKMAENRQAGSRHKRRRLEKIKAKLEAKGYTVRTK